MEARTIGELLLESSTRGPDRAAVFDVAGVGTTYAELLRDTGALAAAVVTAGVTPERAVAVVLPNGPGMANAFLGVSAAAVCAPLNPAYTETEFAFFLDDLDAAALITDGCSPAASAIAEQRGIPVLCPPFFGSAPDDDRRRSPGDVALVLHTSGTTARPKQVPLTHANLCTSAESVAVTLQLQPEDRCLNVMPLFHIHGIVAALLASMSVGGSVVCTPGFDATKFLDWAADLEASWYTAVPTIHQAVLAAVRRDRGAAERGAFRFIRSSSAALAPAVMSDLEAAFAVPVIEAYGMTEASHQMASNLLPPNERKPGTVGVAAGSEVAVMAPDGDLVAAGTTGEIVIRGPAVTNGYVADESVNAAAFAHGWFHTGDQGMLDADGYLTITGRLKELINRGGEKISPREVDEALLEHPSVERAVAFAVPHATLGEDVAAAVVANGDGVDTDDLRRFVATRLAPHKVPQRIVVLDELPTGATGKVQRVGLAERLGLIGSRPASAPDSNTGPPPSPLESAVAAIWAQLLHLDHVGLDERFLELGGDSLTAVALVAQLVDVFGVDISVTAPLVEARTVADMAALITELRLEPADQTSAGDDSDDSVDDLDLGVLTLAQEGMWFLEALDPTSPALHVPVALRWRGPLDVAALEQSLSELVRRHEGLRTRFIPGTNGKPRAIVDPPFRVTLPMEDRDGVPESERVAASGALAKADALARFDLTIAPLFRTRLVRFAAEDYLLSLVVHHLVADGWARGTIRNELAVLYAAISSGAPVDLSPALASFSELAARQRKVLASGALDRHVEYWRRVLTPLPEPVALPADRRAPLVDWTSDVVRVEMSADERARLNALGREHDATQFMVLLAGFVALLHRHTGLTDVVVGVPVAGRTDVSSQGVVGTFVNVLPVRVAVEANTPFTELLQRVRVACLDAYNHQAPPLEWLVRELRPERSSQHRPLVQVSFQLRNLPAVVSELGDVRIEDIDVHGGASQYELSVDVTERDGALGFAFEYPTGRFDRETIEHFAGHLLTLLAQAPTAPHLAVSELPVVTAQEQAILRQFGTGPLLSRPDRCLHDVVAAVAGASPDRVAVEMGGDQKGALSYRELDERANQLAHHLIAAGVERGTSIALCMPRSPDLLVAILGILKAGAAFVPLDPTHPRERLAAIVDDAGAAALVTTEALARSVPNRPSLVVLLGRERADIDRLSREAPVSGCTVDDLAYVLFTSGSTGRPKGVEVEHRQLVAYIDAAQAEVGTSASDAVLAMTSLTFDAFIDELLVPLTVGARVVLADDHLRLDVPGLVRLLNDGGVTIVMGTPTFAGYLLDGGWQPSDISSIWGGEILTPALAGKLLATCAAVWNGYGPTETTDAVAFHRVVQSDVDAGLIPIGHPIAGQVLRVVESSGLLAGIGIEGDLLIGGRGVARGYRNRPDLTAVAFIDVAAEDGPQRMYRSGDRCRWRTDGALEYVGRADGQVKVRGVRIELGDVEAALAAHPAVTAAVADVRDARLVAWVTGPAPQPTADELRRFVSATLPRSMLPSAIGSVEQLPMSSTGKVDRDALPDPPSAQEEVGTPPADGLEAAMAQLWCEFLGLDGAVYRESDFFALGGDSLMTVQLIAEIEQRFLSTLALARVLEVSTLAEMAAAVDLLRESGGIAKPRADPLVLLRRGRGGAAPLFWVPGAGGSPISWKWFAEALDGRADFYCFEAAHHRGMPDPTSLPEMARGYVEALLKTCSTDFAVGGGSFGALVAHEMACQLAEFGRAPGALILVDPQFSDADPGRARELLWRLERRLRPGKPKKAGPRRKRLPWPPSFMRVVEVSHALRVGHTPRSYSGGAIIIASREDRVKQGRNLGLREFVAGPTELVRVAGRHHLPMRDERLVAVAPVIETILARLSAEGEG